MFTRQGTLTWICCATIVKLYSAATAAWMPLTLNKCEAMYGYVFPKGHNDGHVLIGSSKMCRYVLFLFCHVNFQTDTGSTSSPWTLGIYVCSIILICVYVFTCNVFLNL